MITVYTGLMGSGKTAKLIEKQKEISRTLPVLIVKNKIDTRSKFIESRNKEKMIPNLYLNFGEEISIYHEAFSKGYKAIFIDEIQFFDESLGMILNDLSRIGVDSYCSGLKKTYDNKYFDTTIECIKFGQEIFLEMWCEYCETSRAKFIKKLSGSDQRVEVGGSELYKSLCEKCYKVE